MGEGPATTRAKTPVATRAIRPGPSARRTTRAAAGHSGRGTHTSGKAARHAILTAARGAAEAFILALRRTTHAPTPRSARVPCDWPKGCEEPRDPRATHRGLGYCERHANEARRRLGLGPMPAKTVQTYTRTGRGEDQQ